ncbi:MULTISPECIES: trp operon leader peptide [Sodalis]
MLKMMTSITVLLRWWRTSL